MSNLLLQSCSSSKREADGAVPAFDLYTGYFYKILKKSIREEQMRPDVDIAILSAKHGLLDTTEKIEYYDQKMDPERAEALNQSVVDAVVERVENREHDRVVINMGKDYRGAVSGLASRLDTSVAAIPGDGIGEKGQALHDFVRGDNSVLREVDAI